ncbi:hypothetical protein RJT34_03126 [Clitoria ternatea]|uniref:Uncharacterized protein n=1 Tax=Clitoria ternatea TaxID=43366 RepID=A0AAN9PZJ3_CLITE
MKTNSLESVLREIFQHVAVNQCYWSRLLLFRKKVQITGNSCVLFSSSFLRMASRSCNRSTMATTKAFLTFTSLSPPTTMTKPSAFGPLNPLLMKAIETSEEN